MRRPELAQRAQQLGTARLVAHVDGLDDDELLTAKRLGQLRQRRELQDPADRRHLVRHRGRPGVPGVQHLRGALPREEEDAGVDLGDGVQLHLERCDDAEVAAAAPQRPEELCVVVLVDAAQAPVGGDELDRGDAVGGEAELAGVPADAAAQRVAGDAHVGRGAVERGEAELGGAGHDVPPLGAAAHAGAAAPHVDLDALQGVGLDEDDVVHRAERLGVVAGPLGRHLHAVRAGELDDGDDVLLVGRHGHELGLLGEGQVERLRGGVPAVAVGLDHSALEAPLQGLEGGGGLDHGHGYGLLGREVRGRARRLAAVPREGSPGTT